MHYEHEDAFRFQNKLQNLMCEATSILQDRRNIVKVKTTHLRSKVMSDALDAVVEETAPSEYAGTPTKWRPSSCF